MYFMKNNSRPIVHSLLSLGMALLASSVLQAIPVSVLAWDNDVAAMKLALRDSKGSVLIDDMHPSQRTRVYQLVAGEVPPVVEAAEKADSNGTSRQVPLVFPQGIKKALLVILPDAEAPSGIRSMILEDDESGFAWGAIRFINATGKQVVFVHEKKGTALPPSWDPVLVHPGGDQRSIPVKMFFRDQTERAFYSSIWEHQPDVRMIVFLVPGKDARLGPVELKMISEDRRTVAQERRQGKGTSEKN